MTKHILNGVFEKTSKKKKEYNKKRILLIGLLVFITISLSAQNDEKQSLFNELDYGISYYGNNLWNPGLNFRAEYVFYEKIKTKVKQKKRGEKLKVRTHNFLLGGNVGFYWDPKSHVGAFNYYGITYRKTATKGFQYRVGLSPLAYYRSFLPETYEVDDNGNVKKLFLPGRNYYAPVFTLGVGKQRKEKYLNSWFLNLNVMVLMPYNTNILPLLYIEYGYTFNLKKNHK